MKFSHFVFAMVGIVFFFLAVLVALNGCGEEFGDDAFDVDCDNAAKFIYSTCGYRFDSGEGWTPDSEKELAEYCEVEDAGFWECVFDCVEEEVSSIMDELECVGFYDCYEFENCEMMQ